MGLRKIGNQALHRMDPQFRSVRGEAFPPDAEEELRNRRQHRIKARVFILNGLNGASPEGKAECVIANYERIVSICLERSGPMLWKFNKDGSRREIDFRKHLRKMRRHRRI